MGPYIAAERSEEDVGNWLFMLLFDETGWWLCDPGMSSKDRPGCVPKAASGTAVPEEWTTRTPHLMAKNLEFEARGPKWVPRDDPHERTGSNHTGGLPVCMLGWFTQHGWDAVHRV